MFENERDSSGLAKLTWVFCGSKSFCPDGGGEELTLTREELTVRSCNDTLMTDPCPISVMTNGPKM
jgi:hypothetical protein